MAKSFASDLRMLHHTCGSQCVSVVMTMIHVPRVHEITDRETSREIRGQSFGINDQIVVQVARVGVD